MTGTAVRLLRDDRGATVLEFALVAPMLMVLVLGVFDLGYNVYANEMLQGAIQRAARKSTIEGAETQASAIDAIVTGEVRSVVPGATIKFDRRAYSSFTKVARPEDFTDTNANGSCDNGEPFEDANGNGRWDTDAGSAGFGGARDAVLYTVTVTYRRFVPIYAFMPGQNSTFTLKSSTVLRNQPFGAQTAQAAPAVRNCT